MDILNTLVILGNDRIAYQALKNQNFFSNKPIVAIDRSTNFYRVMRLIFKKRLPLHLVVKMMFCEKRRERDTQLNLSFPIIRNNKDLLSLIKKYNPTRIILFRAGLVINKQIISIGIPLLNIHCANIPEYGGLGSIYRALKNKSIHQHATLHQVTKTIDDGFVFDTEPYLLDEKLSYCHNEDIAYQAGLRLLIRTVNSEIGL